MNRQILVCALLIAAAASLGAQQASQTAQSNPYQGTSNPPADDQITTSTTSAPKPPAGKPMASPQAYSTPAPPPDQAQPEPQQEPQLQQRPGWADSAANSSAPGNDDGVVGAEQPATSAQLERDYADDPDGDIVHPHAQPRGEILEGTTIRVRLLERLSTVSSVEGDPFRTQVASDVVQDGRVLIPAGAEIDGTVTRVSSGHTGGHGSMRLVPETVILPNGERLRLHAEISGTPDSRTQVNGEGTITPDSRLKRDGVEYGGAVGAGVVTGAIVGGPVGALAGGLIGAGAITVHLLVDHQQATLERDTIMIFTLTEPLNLIPGTPSQ